MIGGQKEGSVFTENSISVHANLAKSPYRHVST